MKTAYLADNEFKWKDIESLQIEASKYNIRIGSHVTIGSCVEIGSYTTIDSFSKIDSYVEIRSYVTIGSHVTIDSFSTIDSRATIGSFSKIDSDAMIGSDAMIDSGVVISSYIKIREDIKGTVTKAVHGGKIYKYSQDLIYTEKETYIRMGCHTRTVKEWQEDFNNNEKEFPIGSEEHKLRLKAINVFMKILKLEDIK